ncbi:MAG: SusF/SusE family outer membrane protein [Bacteroidales bacterium]|nr:SusF/SusE family outer membrane protein [Bacteroidales bacterium]
MKKSVLFILAAFAILACACSKYGSNPLDGDQAVILTPSSKVITLDPSLEATEALSFTWTPGSNQKTGAGIGYTFEMCIKGDNFQHPYRYELGRTTYRYFSFISAIEDSKGKAISLYAILEGWQSNLDIPAAIRPVIGKPCTIQARIIAKVYSSDIGPVASEAVEVEIAPAIYIIGNATGNEWSLDKAGKFEYKGNGKYATRYQLLEGQLKFPYGTLYFEDKSGNFGNCYVAPVDNTPVVSETPLTLDKSVNNDKDNKFYINDEGVWDIELDINEMTALFTYDSEASGTPPSLYLIGPATGNAWNKPGLEVNGDANRIYTFTGKLYTGEFKFLFKTSALDPQSWQPAFTAKFQDDRENMVLHDDNDYKFVVDSTGVWTLTIDTRNKTIRYAFDKATFEPYESLWMIGSATPNGWDVSEGKPTKMTKAASNVFTWTGELKAGEMKFPVVTGHFKWCFGAKSAGNNQDLVYNPVTGTDHLINVPADGNYTVTVNLNTMKCTLDRN